MFEHDSVMDELTGVVEMETFRYAPDFDRLMNDFRPKFDESPWSPELLEAPDFSKPGSEDKPVDQVAYPMRHMLAMVTPTQMMPVIEVG